MRNDCLLLFFVLATGCGRLLDVGLPTDRVVVEQVFAKDTTAAAVLTGVYYNMSSGGVFTGSGGLGILGGLCADEYYLKEQGLQYVAIWQNAVTPMYVPFWNDLYWYIHMANAAIEGLHKSKTLSEDVKKQLLGEAYFVRAVCYGYLVNFFGDVPLVLGTDANVNKQLPRERVATVYRQVNDDLQHAKMMLSEVYLKADVRTATADRVRPTKWAAMGMMVEMYLYQEEWGLAVKEADSIIAREDLFALTGLNEVFLRHSSEAIWQLAPVDVSYTWEGYLFKFLQPVVVSDALLQAFEAEDGRKAAWLEERVPFKYKQFTDMEVATECLTILRLGEVYLNRAEALAQMGVLEAATADLNCIRRRAGLLPVVVGSKEALLQLIYHERQVELFAEMGHRWVDLKRWGLLEKVMPSATAMKGGVWRSYRQLLPIPEGDLQLNPALTQNVGY